MTKTNETWDDSYCLIRQVQCPKCHVICDDAGDIVYPVCDYRFQTYLPDDI